MYSYKKTASRTNNKKEKLSVFIASVVPPETTFFSHVKSFIFYIEKLHPPKLV